MQNPIYIKRINKCRCGKTKKFGQVNPREKLGVEGGAGKKLVETGTAKKSVSWGDLDSPFPIG